MSRAIALIIGIPLVIFLGYLAWQTGKHYLENLKERNFVEVAVLGRRDELLSEVSKYILDSEKSRVKVLPDIYVKFRNLKDAYSIAEIEFAIAELEAVYNEEKALTEGIWRLLEE